MCNPSGSLISSSDLAPGLGNGRTVLAAILMFVMVVYSWYVRFNIIYSMYMLFNRQEVRMEKNGAHGLEYGLRPRPVLKTNGTVFPYGLT